MNKLLFSLFFLLPLSDPPNGWPALGRVKFVLKYVEELNAELYYPYFDEAIKRLEGKEVSLRASNL
jgi:hypothetical protein